MFMALPTALPITVCGAMHAPGEDVAGGGGENLVLLGVVEVLHVQAALLFAKGGLRQGALSIGLEGAEVCASAP